MPVSDIPSRSTGSLPNIRFDSFELLDQKGGGTGSPEAHVVEIGFSVAPIVHEYGVHGGDRHEHGARVALVLVGQNIQHGLRDEGVQHPDLGAGEKRGVQREAQAVHVEQGQDMAENVRGGNLPDIDDVPGVVDQVFPG